MGDADPDTSSPETDAEEWSEDTLPSSPQHAGYQPLDQGYEALEDDQQEQEQQEEHQQAEEHQQQAEDAVEEGSLSGGDENSQQPDIASAMLRAMEADYRACVESEERLASNGPIATSSTWVLAATEPPSEDHAQLEGNGNMSRERDEASPDGGERGSESVEDVPPPRPISPLGQDQADRVMRAMQGFALAAPAIPPARFEVNWEGPDALANLTPATQAAAATAARASAAAPSAPAPRGGVDEQEGEERRREGSPNEDQRQ